MGLFGPSKFGPSKKDKDKAAEALADQFDRRAAEEDARADYAAKAAGETGRWLDTHINRGLKDGYKRSVREARANAEMYRANAEMTRAGKSGKGGKGRKR